MSQGIISGSEVSMEIENKENLFNDSHEISEANEKSKPLSEHDILNGNFLFHVITEAKASFTDIVDSWVENYVMDETKAIISIIQLILLSSNNKLILTPEIFMKNSLPELYDKICQNFQNQETYYLISEDFSSFGPSFKEFVYKLAKSSRFTFINNDEIMNTLMTFLKLCCNSTFRPLRHTATFFGLIFATGLLYNVASLAENLSKISTEGLNDSEILSSSFSQKERNEEKLIKNHFNFIFKEIFSTRYRDVCPEVRALCIHELGIWMSIYPREIIKDSKLKYIGWLLHDKNSTVRLNCFKSIYPLLSKEISIKLIENFLNKFQDRIIQMVNDINDDVSCEALQALICIIKFRPNFINDEAIKLISHLVKSSNRKISNFSSKLILDFFKIKIKKDPTKVEKIDFLKVVMNCLHEPYDLQNILLVVDSFAKYHQYMASWDSYIHFLLDYEIDSPNLEYQFMCLFYSSVLYFIDCKFPMERQPRKNIQAEITKKSLEERAKFTASIMNSYKSLFNKYCGEKEKALILVSFAQHFDVKVILNNVENQSFVKDVAFLMQNLIMKSFEKEFLTSCIKSLYFLCSNHAEQTQSENLKQKLISKIVDSLMASLHESTEQYIQEKKHESLETINQISGIFSLFMSYFDLSESPVTESLEILIGTINVQDEANREIIDNLFTCKSNIIVAKCSSLNKSHLLSNKSEAEKYSAILLDEILMFQDYAYQIFSSNKTSTDNIFKQLCIVICKIAEKEESQIFFKNPGFQSNLTKLNDLMLKYLSDHVFCHKASNTREDNSKQEVVMCYCSLLIKQIIPIENFKNILRHFSHHQYLSEIIKHVFVELKAFNLKTLCQIVSDTFILCFEECVPKEDNNFNKFSPKYIRTKELSKKIVLHFGVNASHRKNSLLLVQKLVIDHFIANADFSTASQHFMAYLLDIISSFYARTPIEDQKMLLMYLNDKIGPNFDRIVKNWPSIGQYLGIKAPGDNENQQDRASFVEIEE